MHTCCHEAHGCQRKKVRGRRRSLRVGSSFGFQFSCRFLQESSAGYDPPADRVASSSGSGEHGGLGRNRTCGALHRQRGGVHVLLRHGVRTHPQHHLLGDLPDARPREVHRRVLRHRVALQHRRRLHAAPHAARCGPLRRLWRVRLRLPRIVGFHLLPRS